MEFKIKIQCSTGNCLWAHVNPIGLTGVDRIRQEVGAILPLDRIAPKCTSLVSSEVNIEIKEKVARDSNLFDFSNKIEIKVPEEFLNSFVIEVVKVDKNPETGEILHACIETVLDTQAVIKWWEAEGFPTVVS